MNSEKVKEIKKALQDHSIEKLKYQDGIKIKEIDFIDILTLINELEKENEILQGTKDRLTFAERINIVNNAVEIKLKQFAERLKEKIVSMKWAREDTNEKLIKQGATIKAIDETLKEFINETNE
jgi:hypothetical protein